MFVSFILFRLLLYQLQTDESAWSTKRIRIEDSRQGGGREDQRRASRREAGWWSSQGRIACSAAVISGAGSFRCCRKLKSVEARGGLCREATRQFYRPGPCSAFEASRSLPFAEADRGATLVLDDT